MRVASVFGTRLDAMILAYVVKAQENSPNIESLICSTGQRREKFVPQLKVFNIKPDDDLATLLPGQNLISFFSRTLANMSEQYDKLSPDRVRVPGENTTAGLQLFTTRTLSVTLRPEPFNSLNLIVKKLWTYVGIICGNRNFSPLFHAPSATA
jgi:UDP-N-acetylglucosamine 2-epimerase